MKTELKTNKKQIKTTAFALTCVWSLSYIFILSVKDIDFFMTTVYPPAIL